MKNLKTAFAYAKDYTTTGAISKSSEWVENGVTRFVDKEKIQLIVEFGAGHGNITKVILNKMHPESKLISFEINEDFCIEMNQNIKDTRLQLINGSATDIDKYVEENSLDSIISSLPITFIPNEIVDEIYEKAQKALKPDTYMLQWLYSPLHFRVFKRFFSNVKTESGFGIPMEFIKICKK